MRASHTYGEIFLDFFNVVVLRCLVFVFVVLEMQVTVSRRMRWNSIQKEVCCLGFPSDGIGFLKNEK